MTKKSKEMTRKWWRENLNFPFKIIYSLFRLRIKIKVHPNNYEECKELCYKYLPAGIECTVIKDESILREQLFEVENE